jgi:hypothetical protein
VRKSVVAVLAAVAVAGAAVAAVPMVERHAAARIKADLERDGNKAGSVDVSLLSRKVAVADLQARQFGDVTVGRLEASGLAWPLAELVRGRTPFSGFAPGDPLHAAHVEIHDLRVVQDTGRWGIASLAITGFQLDRYEPVSGPDQIGHLVARLAGALSMEHLEQKGTTFVDPASNDRVTVDSLAVDRFEKGRVGSLTMSGFDFTAKPPRDPVFRMADFKLTDLDLRRTLKSVAATNWRPGMPLGRVELGSTSLSGFSGEAFSRYGLALGSITQQSQPDGKDVRHSRLRIEGFVLDPSPRSREGLQLRMVLQAMGLKQLKLESECSGTEDRGRGEISIDRCALTGPELGEANLSMRVVQADAPFWQAIDEGNTMALLGSKVGIGGARIVVADRGLLERSIKAVATTTGQSQAEVRADLAQEIRRFQPPGILITEDLGKLLDTVARFIERGGTLTLEAKPDSPIGLDKARYLSQPGADLVNVLGLTATLSP